MKRTRLGQFALVALAALAVLAEPAAAHASTTDRLISQLNTDLLYVAVPVTLITEAALIYAVWKFRANDEPEPTKENRRLEITWTVATAIILLFVGVASYGVLASPDVTHTADMAVAPEDDDVVVDAEAFQWGWNFAYPEANVTAPGTTVVVPVDQDIYFRITSTDVIHGFSVPGLSLKVDAMPGQTNVIQTRTLETGTYQGYCTEFCGSGHSQMLFTVKVVPQEEYEQFIAEQRSG